MSATALIRFAFLIVIRRFGSDWRIQATAGFGVLLAVALMAAGVIYSKALAETALANTLASVSDEELDITYRTFHQLELPAFEASNNYVDEFIRKPIQPFMVEDVLLIQTSTLFLSGSPRFDVPSASRPRSSVQSISKLPEHVIIIQGRFPRANSDRLEVIIDSYGASELSISIGDQFNAFRPESIVSHIVPIEVVGIFEPLDRAKHYWAVGGWDRFTNTSREWAALPLYTGEDQILKVLPSYIPALQTDFLWLFTTDRIGLSADHVDGLQTAIKDIKEGIRNNVPNSSWRTELDTILEEYSSLLLLARVPLLLVIFLVVSVLLYYMFLIAGLIGRVRTAEIAVFRSRGASTTQVLLVIFVEGLIIALPGVIVGPFLAQMLVALTGYIFPMAAGGQSLAVGSFSISTFALGALAALFTVVVYTFTIMRASNKGIVALQTSSSRPPEMPFIHRYYIDLALLIIIGFLWWQIKSRGSFLIQPAMESTTEIDVTLLLGPVVGILVAGLVIMRIIPIALRFIRWIMEPWSPAWVVHALNGIARDPIPASSLLVLLALASSLGMLGSLLLSTLERSQEDQARYEAGTDLRIEIESGDQLKVDGRLLGELNDKSGVSSSTEVFRFDTRVTTESFGSSAELLAIDAKSFLNTAWIRQDLVERSTVSALMPTELGDEKTRGFPLPLEATAIGIWVQAGRLPQRTFLNARLQDDNGSYFDVNLGEVQDHGWHYMEQSIPKIRPKSRRYSELKIKAPVTLRSLWLSGRGSGSQSGVIFFNELRVLTEQSSIEIPSFQVLGRWHTIDDVSTPGLYDLSVTEGVVRNDRSSMSFTWIGGTLATRGISYGNEIKAVPGIVSKELLNNKVQVGDIIPVFVQSIAVPVVVVDSLEFFPTLDPREEPFLIVDAELLLEYIYLHSNRNVNGAEEIWLKLNEGYSTSEVIESVKSLNFTPKNTFQADEMIQARTSDPLLAAGWTGLLTVSFLAVIMASTSGLILYTYVDVRGRVSEFAILRSLGFSKSQVNGLVWFNLGITIVFGLVIGTLGGQLLGISVLPLLEVAEDGSRITPPMAIRNNWYAMVVAYAVIGVATFVTVLTLAWAIGRLELQKLIRLTDA